MIDRQRCLVALLVVVLALCAALSVGATVLSPQNQYPPGESSDGGCYCGTALCGCSSAPPGYSLTASCTCGTTCTRTCTYTSTKG